MIKLNFDKDFIEKLTKQDQQAFNEFYLETVDIFFRYIQWNYFLSKEETEDIISDFYVKWWSAVKKYKSEKSFNAFMWTIFKNLIKDYFKKNKIIWFTKFENGDWDCFEDYLEDDINIWEILESEYQYKHIKKAMKKLDKESREIIYLKFIEEKNNQEISEITNLSNDNIRKKISRSLRKLKVLLDNDKL